MPLALHKLSVAFLSGGFANSCYIHTHPEDDKYKLSWCKSLSQKRIHGVTNPLSHLYFVFACWKRNSFQSQTFIYLCNYAGNAEEVTRGWHRGQAWGQWENPGLMYTTHGLHQGTHHKVKITAEGYCCKWAGKSDISIQILLESTISRSLPITLEYLCLQGRGKILSLRFIFHHCVRFLESCWSCMCQNDTCQL